MRIMGLDPGETTGATIIDIPSHIVSIPLKSEISNWVQYAGELENWFAIESLIKEFTPDVIVIEEFRLYADKAKSKIGHDFPEVKIIGQIEMIAQQQNIPIHKQGAGVVKQFYTDERLKSLNMWQSGQRHARDAVRHALYFFDFNKKKVFNCNNCFTTKHKDICVSLGCNFTYKGVI